MNRKIEQNIIHFISKKKLVGKGDKLLIALSGGPDSIFALHFFHKFKSKFEIDIAAMHVNHLLRGDESDGDEIFCKSLCKKLSIKFSSVKVDVKTFAEKKKQSIEEAARNLRYQKLTEYASKIGAAKIVTAHNLEDNTETVLLNLFRGTGLKGAGGIPVRRGNIIRPLLSVSKEDIIDYLNSKKHKYRIDSSNLENDFTRNYLRNKIIPKIKENINYGIDNNILRFSEIALQSEKAIHDYANEISEKFITKSESGIAVSNLIADEKFENIFPNSIKLGLEKEFNKVFTFGDISKIKSIFSSQVGSKAELSNSITALRERDSLFISSKKKRGSSKSYELLLNEKVIIGKKTISAKIIKKADAHYSLLSNVEIINGDAISFPLTIRKWKSGDRFKPIGLKGTKNISDFLTEAKVNSRNKSEQLVLLNGNKIIWVVGYRIDESVKINNETKRIIKLFVRRI